MISFTKRFLALKTIFLTFEKKNFQLTGLSHIESHIEIGCVLLGYMYNKYQSEMYAVISMRTAHIFT